MDWLDFLAVQGTLKSVLQHHSSKPSVLQCSAFFMVQLSYPNMTTGKTMLLLPSCSTLCDPTDGSPPGSPVPEILQARTLEWVAISFSTLYNVGYHFSSKIQLHTLRQIHCFSLCSYSPSLTTPKSLGLNV